MADDRILKFEELRDYGWPHTRAHTARLVREGKFPAPFKQHESGRRNYWTEIDITTFIARQKRTRQKVK